MFFFFFSDLPLFTFYFVLFLILFLILCHLILHQYCTRCRKRAIKSIITKKENLRGHAQQQMTTGFMFSLFIRCSVNKQANRAHHTEQIHIHQQPGSPLSKTLTRPNSTLEWTKMVDDEQKEVTRPHCCHVSALLCFYRQSACLPIGYRSTPCDNSQSTRSVLFPPNTERLVFMVPSWRP